MEIKSQNAWKTGLNHGDKNDGKQNLKHSRKIIHW